MPQPPTPGTPPARPHPPWPRQPLVPATVAFGMGIVAGGAAGGSPRPWTALAAATLLAWVLAAIRARRRSGLPGGWMAMLLLLAAGFGGAAWVGARPPAMAADDIARFAGREPQPIRLRATLDDEPASFAASGSGPFRAIPAVAQAVTVATVEAVSDGRRWRPASGRIQLSIAGQTAGLHAGQAVTVIGSLSRIEPPGTPGQYDRRAGLRRRGVRAAVACKYPECVTWADDRGGRSAVPPSPGRLLAAFRGRAQRSLADHLPPPAAALAGAMLLGTHDGLEPGTLEQFRRTGTVHVIVIAGLHLGVLVGFVWWLARLVGLPYRATAAAVLGLAIAYMLLTGSRPPVVRAAVLVSVYCLAAILRRQARPASSLAAAALVIWLWDPEEVLDVGFQLSFLAVATIYWLILPLEWRWLHADDPITCLADAQRPWWDRSARRLGRHLGGLLLFSTVLWAVSLPLVAARFHVVPLAGIPLGALLLPIVSVVLVSGFLVIAAAMVWPPLAWPFAAVCRLGLAALETPIRSVDGFSWSCWWVAGPPDWWLAGFYLGLAVLILWVQADRPAGLQAAHRSTDPGRQPAAPAQPPLGRVVRRWIGVGLGWAAIGLVAAGLRPATGRLECACLSVGHGLCVVLHLPDGQTVLYDCGHMTGPDVGDRVIAPYLWSKGITALDAVFLSHVDVDHFNGLPALADRFRIGAVYVAPSFAYLPKRAVRATLDHLAARGVPIRFIWAGDRLRLGASVLARVLHPLPESPTGARFHPGADNRRSLVLVIESAGRRVLLPGDLEGPGMDRLLRLPPPAGPGIDLLVAPHHGSKNSNAPGLIAWARPRLVVFSEGRPRPGTTARRAFEARGIPVLSTWADGTVAVRFDGRAMEARTIRGRKLHWSGSAPASGCRVKKDGMAGVGYAMLLGWPVPASALAAVFGSGPIPHALPLPGATQPDPVLVGESFICCRAGIGLRFGGIAQ